MRKELLAAEDALDCVKQLALHGPAKYDVINSRGIQFTINPEEYYLDITDSYDILGALLNKGTDDEVEFCRKMRAPLGNSDPEVWQSALEASFNPALDLFFWRDPVDVHGQPICECEIAEAVYPIFYLSAATISDPLMFYALAETIHLRAFEEVGANKRNLLSTAILYGGIATNINDSIYESKFIQLNSAVHLSQLVSIEEVGQYLDMAINLTHEFERNEMLNQFVCFQGAFSYMRKFDYELAKGNVCPHYLDHAEAFARFDFGEEDFESKIKCKSLLDLIETKRKHF